MSYDKVFKERPFKWGDASNFMHYLADERLVSRLHEAIKFKQPITTDEEKVEYFRRRLLEEYENNKNVRMAVDVCVHCGQCMNACPTYITTGDPYNSPLGRAELIRAVIKADKVSGKLFGKAVGAVKKIDMNYIKKIYTYYWLCLICRRCGYACPLGVEQTDVTRAVRGILYEIGMASRFTALTVDAHWKNGNNMNLTPGAVKSIIDFVVKEIKQEKGIELKVKIDEPAYALLLPSSADYFMNMETLKGYLLFLYAAGIDYTLSTKAAETANFGLFLHPKHLQGLAEKYVSVARELGVKLVIAGECGHAWRAHKNYTLPRLREYGIKLVHIHHLVAKAIREGRIKLNPEANGNIVYMYQDPCQYARGGDLTEEPRFILSHVARSWVDPEHNRSWTWCCGGQGGNLTDEVVPLVTQYARLWYEEALKKDAQWVIRPCSICKAQLSHVVPYLNKMYGKEIKYSGLMDLVYRALVV
ncbi:(Fe-S)-binding protein [Vulcanisaeta souniana]|uniref:Iron-sulfur protein n=1 Tax=Vulcanisaeta souniana JCM 11219 TaxID=1293586 RepID=A0A830E337_9CREN|nr:(Fe-S)-binding protein [Vulcanisaeta souniana]BDR93472.1 iron-sulfur protein [Vulcanisaeta souniana JCM 11219]GGI77419.1 iron-sulfur protein [Vulcanisaeta souniana JCM 11219]